MTNVLESLINSLGKPAKGGLQQIGEVITETPAIDRNSSSFRIYRFFGSGVKVIVLHSRMIWVVEFFLSNADVKEGKYKPYCGELPFGITAADTQELVEIKLSGHDYAVQSSRPDNLIIEAGDHSWTFFFDDSDQKLCYFSVLYNGAYFRNC